MVSDAVISPLDKDARTAELEAALAVCDTLIETLRFQLSQLRRMTFGQSSEKLALQIEQLVLALKELEGEAEVAGARKPDWDCSERASPARALPAHLPRDERRIEPDAGNCTCPDCGGVLRSLAEDSDEMLDVAPLQWRVIRTVRPKYSCRSCEKIVQAAAPVKAIARGKASFATLANVVVAKGDHHLPLYRQAEMMAAPRSLGGIDIDRSTLAGWAGQAAHLLDPIVTRIRDEGLKAAKIHTDDTPVPMLVPGPRADARRFNKQPDCVRRGKTAQTRLWAYVVDDRASCATGPALVWYKFTPDRSGIHPQTELKTFTGLLQADAYAGYEKLYVAGAIQEVACWAHFRRKIFENHQTSPTPLTTDLLERIAALYRIEADVRGQPPDLRRQRLQEMTKPLIDELCVVIDNALRRLSPKSCPKRYGGQGACLSRKRWPVLTRFVENGSAEIDNNIAERAMRSIAIGRENWLFAGSKSGGERAAAIYSVIETAKLNSIEPQDYIADVIEKIASGWPASRWDELMPWNWQPVEQKQIAQAA